MEIFLFITYIVVFIMQIVLFVSAIRKRKKRFWILLFSAEIIPLFIAYMLMHYYDNLPGYGFMSGFTYMGEVLFSFGAAVLYGVVFLISVVSYIVIIKNRDRTCN